MMSLEVKNAVDMHIVRIRNLLLPFQVVLMLFWITECIRKDLV